MVHGVRVNPLKSSPQNHILLCGSQEILFWEHKNSFSTDDSVCAEVVVFPTTLINVTEWVQNNFCPKAPHWTLLSDCRPGSEGSGPKRSTAFSATVLGKYRGLATLTSNVSLLQRAPLVLRVLIPFLIPGLGLVGWHERTRNWIGTRMDSGISKIVKLF